MATPNYDAMSLAELGRRLIDNVSELVEKQIALAKQELREDIRSNIRAIVLFVAGGMLLLFATVCLLIALIDATMLLFRWRLWGAALLWFVIFAVIGAICLLLGRQRLRVPPLQRSRAIVQEEMEWARQRLTPPAR
ncbi:MAG: phage holin family protein [Chloroflexi bacterium]|nr:phage holin family protein [Chloroflexota bacterium]